MNRALAALLLLAATSASAGTLDAHDGWIRAAPPGATMLAGYLVLTNHGAAPLKCSALSSPAFGAVEMHRTVVEHGMSHMVEDKTIDVPAGGETRFAPGAAHLMLMQPRHALKSGDKVTLKMQCGGEAVSVEMVLRATE
jgi:copper(I)-binding protein